MKKTIFTRTSQLFNCSDSYRGDENGPSYENENEYDNGYEEEYRHDEIRREQESPMNYPPLRRSDDVNYDLTPPRSMQSYDGRRGTITSSN